jgi:mRNA interferase MazF
VAKFVKGEVVVVPFPFSDLSRAKRRLAFVLANLDGNDIILCQITSRMTADRYAIPSGRTLFSRGASASQVM